MAVEKSQSQDVDLDRTDRLPVFDGAVDDEEGADDSVRLDYAPLVASVKTDFPKTHAVDLPLLAESVRSVEERIARQNAENEALSRSYEKARDSEAAAVARAHSLASDVAALRGMLETEQARLRDMDRHLAERNAAAEVARTRAEEALREMERHQSEARTLRDTLTARDNSVAQVTHSLGERDAQLSALQREHANVVPALEERSRAASQLAQELHAERERSAGLGVALRDAQQAAAALTLRVRSIDDELHSTRRDLQQSKTQAASYLDTLRTREWRRGFDQNLFRELDAKIGAAQTDHGALQAERDQLRQRVAEMESKVLARDEAIAKLQAAAVDDEELRLRHEMKLGQIEDSRTELMHKITALDSECSRLSGEVEAREARINELHAARVEAETLRASHEATVRNTERAHAELVERITALDAEGARLADELAARDETIAELRAAGADGEAARAGHEQALQRMQQIGDGLEAQITALEHERDRLRGELALRENAANEALTASRQEALHHQGLLAAASKEHAELAGQLTQLHADIRRRDEEMASLAAQLKDARRPLEPFEVEIKRLREEIAAKTAGIEQLAEENKSLRASLERAKGALQEREFLIRRLERSESNNANVLGRIQTSIERLGSPTAIAGNPAAPVECTAELVRIDQPNIAAHPLARRTRIGRASGCELQIDSTSVSRHHALLLMSARDVIIEDLNSTNGVLVNGRKVSRQLLSDGDVVAIGDAQFRLNVKVTPRSTLESPAPEPQ